jgi:hypothetical protein
MKFCYFQGHRSKVKVTGSNFWVRGYATLCIALVKLVLIALSLCTDVANNGIQVLVTKTLAPFMARCIRYNIM